MQTAQQFPVRSAATKFSSQEKEHIYGTVTDYRKKYPNAPVKAVIEELVAEYRARGLHEANFKMIYNQYNLERRKREQKEAAELEDPDKLVERLNSVATTIHEIGNELMAMRELADSRLKRIQELESKLAAYERLHTAAAEAVKSMENDLYEEGGLERNE